MAINVTTTGTITASVTASTISFTAPDTMSDSGGGFGVFSPGDYVQISGTASNDGNRKVLTANANTITFEGAAQGVGSITTEAAGASMTVAAGVGLELFLNTNYVGEPVVLIHPSTTDLRGDNYRFKPFAISQDTLLGAAIDGGDVTMTVDSKAIPTGTTLLRVGSGFVGDDAGAEPWSDTLAAGNTSGGNNAQMSSTDQLQFGGTVNYIANGGTGSLEYTSNKGHIFTVDALNDFIVTFAGAGTATFNSLAPTGGSFELQSQVGTIEFEDNTTGFMSTMDVFNGLTANRIWTFPDQSGTVALLSDIQASDEWSEVLANGNTSGASNAQMTGTTQMQFGGTANYISLNGSSELETVAASLKKFSVNNLTVDMNGTNRITSFTDSLTGFFMSISSFGGWVRATQGANSGTLTMSAVGAIGWNMPQRIGGKVALSGNRDQVSDTNKVLLIDDTFTAVTAITATRTITLPDPTTVESMQIYTIKDESGSVTPSIKITVNVAGGDTIDGVTSIDITAAYGVLKVYSNGNDRFTV